MYAGQYVYYKKDNDEKAKTQSAYNEFDDIEFEDDREQSKEKVSFSLENSEDEDYEEPSEKQAVTLKKVAKK